MLLPFAGSASAEPNVAKSPRVSDIKKAENLIDGMRTEAAYLAGQAAGLQAWSLSSDMSWQSHAGTLEEVRGRLKTLEMYRTKLASLEGRILPEQAAVLDRTAPALRGIASNVGSAVVASHELKYKPALLEDRYVDAVNGFYEHVVEFRRALRAGDAGTSGSSAD